MAIDLLHPYFHDFRGVLSGHHGRAGTVPPRVAVPLLAALLPLRQTTVQKWVEKAVGDGMGSASYLKLFFGGFHSG